VKSRMIYVVGHVTQGFGAVQALQNHLAREAMTFCVIEHPLFVERAWTTAAYHSTYRRYVKGREVAQRRGPCVLRPQALRYLKDVLYTVWCGFREPECIDLFIGINNLNALSGLCLKWLGRVRRVVFYTVDYARTARFATPALNAIYRDVRYVLPFLVQFWLFASPVAYPGSLVPERWRWLYGLNPMAGVIEGFRWALTGRGQPPGPLLLASAGAVLVLLIGGLLYFRKMEDTIADVV